MRFLFVVAAVLSLFSVGCSSGDFAERQMRTLRSKVKVDDPVMQKEERQADPLPKEKAPDKLARKILTEVELLSRVQVNNAHSCCRSLTLGF